MRCSSPRGLAWQFDRCWSDGTNTGNTASIASCPGARPVFIGVRTEGLKADSGVGFLGMGQQPPPHQRERLGERCELPQRGSGRSTDRPKIFSLFSALRVASRGTIILLNVDYHEAIGGQDPTPPCVRTPTFQGHLKLSNVTR